MEQKEFSLEGFTDYCKLKWSKPRLSRNLHWYRKAATTEEFWEWYCGDGSNPDQKTQMKAYLRDNGISIYKEFGRFGLFDWNFKDEGTQEEYDRQQEKRDAELKELLIPELLGQVSQEDTTTFKEAKEFLDGCDTAEQIEEYAKHNIIKGKWICEIVENRWSLV